MLLPGGSPAAAALDAWELEEALPAPLVRGAKVRSIANGAWGVYREMHTMMQLSVEEAKGHPTAARPKKTQNRG